MSRSRNIKIKEDFNLYVELTDKFFSFFIDGNCKDKKQLELIFNDFIIILEKCIAYKDNEMNVKNKFICSYVKSNELVREKFFNYLMRDDNLVKFLCHEKCIVNDKENKIYNGDNFTVNLLSYLLDSNKTLYKHDILILKELKKIDGNNINLYKKVILNKLLKVEYYNYKNYMDNIKEVFSEEVNDIKFDDLQSFFKATMLNRNHLLSVKDSVKDNKNLIVEYICNNIKGLTKINKDNFSQIYLYLLENKILEDNDHIKIFEKIIENIKDNNLFINFAKTLWQKMFEHLSRYDNTNDIYIKLKDIDIVNDDISKIENEFFKILIDKKAQAKKFKKL